MSLMTQNLDEVDHNSSHTEQSCTQCVTTQDSVCERYEEDPQSVPYTGIVARVRDENKQVTVVPKYFFLSDSTIVVGSGHRTDNCDVIFPGMDRVGMSDCSFAITFAEEPLALTLKSSNSNNIHLRRANGEVIIIRKGDENIPIYKGDSIEFNDFGAFTGCGIVFHNAPMPPGELNRSSSNANVSSEADSPMKHSGTDTALSSLKRRAHASIAHLETSLENAKQDVLEAPDIDSLNAALEHLSFICTTTLHTSPQRQSRTPVISDTRDRSIVNENDQSTRKRKVTFADEKMESQPKRSNADSQERRQFQTLQRKVRNAKATLKKPIKPNQHGKKKLEQAQREAKRVLSEASRTKCYFDSRLGGCREGAKCPFMHKLPHAREATLTGVIYKWIPARGKEYGFIRIDGSSQQLYCSDTELVHIEKPMSLPVQVLITSTRKGIGGKLPEALGVHQA